MTDKQMTDKPVFGLQPPDPPPPPTRKLEIIQGDASGDSRYRRNYRRNADFVLCPLTDTSANILHISGTSTKTYRLVAYVNNATPRDLEVIKALLRVL